MAYCFPNLETIHCCMSSSNCCFLIFIQVLQEEDKVVWYSHLLKNFPQFVVTHTVKDFSVVNEAEVVVFLEFSCLFYDPTDVSNVISGSFAFSKSRLNIWKFSVHVMLKLSLEDFELACEMNPFEQYEHSLASPFFGIGMKTDLFQSCGHCWVFQNFWQVVCSTFTASSFRIWNSSTRILSPPLTLFIVRLPKTHLTSLQDV